MSTPSAGQKLRRTKVRRVPMWDPHNKMWRYIPVDKAHTQTVERYDADGDPMGITSVYEAKGWVPMDRASVEAKMTLPTNWKAFLADSRVKPEFVDPKQVKAKATA